MSWATASGAAEHTGSPDTDIAIGAPEPTITRFIHWILRVVKSIDRHKKDPRVEEQRRRSGEAKYSSGLTTDEKMLKAAREQARSDFQYGADLNRRLELYEGRGKGKGKGKRDHMLWPIPWQELSWHQYWYVQEFRKGKLKKAKQAAEAAYRPRSAETPAFRVYD